jgi:mannose-6-phosphate isomerase-like protein (cupin superfamily)
MGMAKTIRKAKTKAVGRRAKSAVRRAGSERSTGKARAGDSLQQWPRQSFTVSHFSDKDYKKGLRSYAKYRDLGVAKATKGAVVAHVIRLLGRCDPEEVSKRHYHDVDFQLVFMLKGWMKGEYNGRKITMRPGSCWIQPKKIKHTVLDYSEDCEMLEIVLPAQFDTVEL